MKRIILFSGVTILLLTGIIIAGGKKNNSLPLTGTATISGVITDVDFGNPIANATIEIKSEKGKTETTSDSLGNYIFSNLEADKYQITFFKENYVLVEKKIELKNNDQLKLDVKLQTEIIIEEMVIREKEDSETGISPQKREDKSYKKVEANQSYSGQIYMADATYEGIEADYGPDFNTESYNAINENIFKKVIGNPLSTFSIDVDNASYSNIRRFINNGQVPPKDAVRIEEMVNYFDYTYNKPKGNDPFSINYEMSECPWNKSTKLIMVGLQGKEIDYSEADASNLVFLIDVSGSMQDANKLPLVKHSLISLIDNLNEKDRVAIVVYAGAAGEVLPSTTCSNKQKIKDAINNLEAGGSTAGGAGIKLAYDIAVKNLIPEGNNRVILCSDGDFNVGTSSDAEMTRLVEEKRKTGVFLTICGFGLGNYKDSKMETIADNGNGAYYYIDDEKEAKKVFTTDMRGTLFTIAKDVKIQIEFNPALVEEYRLIGYENRALNNEDFDNDAKDAGELGAGHRVTAMYEIKLRANQYQPSGSNEKPNGETLKYQTTEVNKNAYNTDEIMTLKLRFKAPNSETSKLIEKSLSSKAIPLASTSDNFRFASAVIEFGMILRDSEYKGDATYEEAIKLANSARGLDTYGYREDFINMLKTCTGLAANK